MKLFYREQTRNSPRISFDPKTGEFEISGRSFMENAYDFYEELFGWIEEYSEEPSALTKLNIFSDYQNTESYKCLLELILKLEKIQDHDHDVQVTWWFDKDDDESREAGEDLNEVAMIRIQVKEVKTGILPKDFKG